MICQIRVVASPFLLADVPALQAAHRRQPRHQRAAGQVNVVGFFPQHYERGLDCVLSRVPRPEKAMGNGGGRLEMTFVDLPKSFVVHCLEASE